MTSDPRFSWTDFYMEFASKLLAHYNDRTRLVEAVHRVSDRLNFRYLRKDQYADGSVGPLQDICPFTTMGTFNRGIVAANKHRIADELGRFLHVRNSAPESFDGIPVLNNQQSWFFRFAKDRDEDDIDVLWEVFTAAIQLANDDNDQTHRDFAKSYDSAIALPQVSLNLTIGLYWLRPHRFLTLDSKSRAYIDGELGITLPSEMPPSGSEYLELVDRVGARISESNSPVHSFAELAWTADKPTGPAVAVPNPSVWLVRAGANGEDDYANLEHGLAIIGWDEVPDLANAPDMNAIREQVQETYPDKSNQSIGSSSSQLKKYVLDIQLGDIIVLPLKTQPELVAMGTVTGPYVHREVAGAMRHTRSVNWIRPDILRSDFGQDLHQSLNINRTIYLIQGNDAERRVATMLDGSQDPDLDSNEETIGPEQPPLEPRNVPKYGIDHIVDDGCFIERSRLIAMLNRLKTKKNLILQGPPGTGKTWLAKKLAFALIGGKDDGRVRRVQFHPNLSYEDFIQGYRPDRNGKLTLVDGPFLEVIDAAKRDLSSDYTAPYVVVIEEVNRGNPAQIFGEMLTLLEADKRDRSEALRLAYATHEYEAVYIPKNLYVIGTMNVADRSIALVDLALRRRFAFVDLEPTFGDVWRDWVHKQTGLAADFLTIIEERMLSLNKRISEDRSLGPQFRVGHSYVTPTPGEPPIEDAVEWFTQVVETDIGPLLDEYWFDDVEKANDAKSELLKNLP